MSTNEFHWLVNSWPEAVLLVAADGTILSGSRSIEEQTGLPLKDLCGRSLGDVAEYVGDISEYLRSCARSRQLIPGSLAFSTPGGPKTHCRVQGAVLRPRTADHPALILLRLVPKQMAIQEFLTLNEKVEELGKEVRQRRQAQAQLEDALRVREVLLREINHRVKNNLQIVASLLDLRAVEAENQRELQVLKEVRSRIHVIAMVHQRLYGTESLEKINLGAFLQELGSDLIGVYKSQDQPIGVDFDMEHTDVRLDTAVTCGLLTHELISNALKHAFPEGRSGTVQVALTRSAGPGEISLRISDDGIGIPNDFDLLNSQTLGMELIYSLARQIGGSVSVDNERGTTFTITFPAQVTGE